MNSMYDAIRRLPLFKGFSEDDVSDFLSFTKLDLQNFNSGDRIFDFGQKIDKLGLVLSGQILITTHLMGEDIVLTQTLDEGCWIFPEHLFGLSNESYSAVESHGKTCVLWLSKAKLLELMKDHSLCRINYVNYLSYKAQSRNLSMQRRMDGSELEQWFERVMIHHTERRALSIKLVVKQDVLADHLSISENELKSQIQALSRKRKITFANNVMIVKSRRDYF